jgi:hypothetical protein
MRRAIRTSPLRQRRSSRRSRPVLVQPNPLRRHCALRVRRTDLPARAHFLSLRLAIHGFTNVAPWRFLLRKPQTALPWRPGWRSLHGRRARHLLVSGSARAPACDNLFRVQRELTRERRLACEEHCRPQHRPRHAGINRHDAYRAAIPSIHHEFAAGPVG